MLRVDSKHHWGVPSASHGVLLTTPGTAECNTHNTVDRGCPNRHASCAQDAILSRHAPRIQKWVDFKTALAMMLDTCLCAWAGMGVSLSLRCMPPNSVP